MKPNNNETGIKILLVISREGTIDHAISLKNQLSDAGATVDYSLARPDLNLPDWAKIELSECEQISLSAIANLPKQYSAVWFQEPYEEFFTEEMKKILRSEFSIYSGYGLPMSNWTRGLFGLPFFGLCNLVSTASPHLTSAYQDEKTFPENTIWTGDPFLFDLTHSSSSPSTKEAKQVLWAPHWSDTWIDGSRGFSRWRETVGPLLRFFKKHPNVTLIIRSHPLLNPSSRADTLFQKKLKKLQSLDNVQISTTSMKDDIMRSDALISDGVSIIAYFAAIGKPVGFIEVKKHQPPFSSVGRAISKSGSTLSTPKEIEKWLRDVTEGVDKFQNRSKESRNLVLQLFPLHKSSPGSQIVSFLLMQDS